MLILAFWACSTGGLVVDDSSKTGDDSAEDSVPSNVETPKLAINEILASNTATIADEAGEFDDWIELYNYGDTLINFDGLYLTDNTTQKTQWALPAGQGLAPGEFQLIWCDNTPDQGTFHTSFQLNKGGDDVYIFMAVDGQDAVRVDGVKWTAEEDDLASARVPNGTGEWVHQAPTPGESNK